MISVEWSKRDSLSGGVALLRSTDYAPGPHSLRSISVVTFLGVRSELLLVVRSGSPQNPFWSIVFSSPPTATAFWISQLRYREIRDLILLYEHDGTVVSLSEYSTIAESYHQDGARAPAQMPKNYVALVGELPSGASNCIKQRLGVYEEQSGTQYNGRPCYRQVGDDAGPGRMIWSCKIGTGGPHAWMAGNSAGVGKTNGALHLASNEPLEQASGTWQMALANGGTWAPAPDVRVLGDAAPNEVQETGERSRAEKDAELRKRAVDLEYDTPRKRSRTQASQLEERVAKARSSTNGAIKRRMKELAAADYDEFMEDKIDAAELERRKEATRVQATADHQQRTALDKAYDEYTAAGEAREAACKAQAAAADVEEAAEAALHKVLQLLEAGPSGAVKAEQ